MITLSCAVQKHCWLPHRGAVDLLFILLKKRFLNDSRTKFKGGHKPKTIDGTVCALQKLLWQGRRDTAIAFPELLSVGYCETHRMWGFIHIGSLTEERLLSPVEILAPSDLVPKPRSGASAGHSTEASLHKQQTTTSEKDFTPMVKGNLWDYSLKFFQKIGRQFQSKEGYR